MFLMLMWNSRKINLTPDLSYKSAFQLVEFGQFQLFSKQPQFDLEETGSAM